MVTRFRRARQQRRKQALRALREHELEELLDDRARALAGRLTLMLSKLPPDDPCYMPLPSEKSLPAK